jgi:phage/plasmid-associated DNA primase
MSPHDPDVGNFAHELYAAVRTKLPADIKPSANAIATAFVDGFSAINRELSYCQRRLYIFEPETGCHRQLDQTFLSFLIMKSGVGGRDWTSRSSNQMANDIAELSFKEPSYFDESNHVIATLNGYLRYESDADAPESFGRVCFHEGYSPAFRCLNVCPTYFSENSDTSPTLEFLSDVLGDLNAAESLLRLFGLALFGLGDKAARLALLYGTGGNGKGTLLEFMSAPFSENTVSAVPPSELVKDYARRVIAPKLNVVGEWDSTNLREIQQLKELTTGERIYVRSVRHDGFTTRSTALIAIATNTLPDLGFETPALRRRMTVFNCTNKIPVEKQDRRILQTLKSKALPGLLTLLVQEANLALHRLSHGTDAINMSEAIDAASGQLFATGQCLENFLSSQVTLTTNSKDRVDASTLHHEYENHCRRSGMRPLSMRDLKRALEERGLEQIHSDGHKWMGMALKPAPDLMEGMEGPEVS